jgi:hypothetical protein
MRHKPNLAGERVTCSKCGGQYFEPTDPLPGVRPQIAPPIAGEVQQHAPVSASPQQRAAPAPPTHAADATDKTEKTPEHSSPTHPQEMVIELERRGLHALLIAWPPAAPEQAGLVYSPRLGREGADAMLLEVAFQLISARWPELHQLLMNYQKQIR